MRMDLGESRTAADVVNRYTREQLIKVFTDYGEERHAGRIADGIIERRKVRPFTRTVELAEAIKEYMPGHGRGEDQHPARRCFQALRIEVNHELDGVESLDERHQIPQSGRKVRDNLLPFARRQDRKGRIQEGGESVYLPEGFPGMRMRQETFGNGNNEETDRTRRI